MALIAMEAVRAPPVLAAALDAGCHILAEKPSWCAPDCRCHCHYRYHYHRQQQQQQQRYRRRLPPRSPPPPPDCRQASPRPLCRHVAAPVAACSVDVKDMAALIATADAKGLHVMMALSNRLNPEAVKAKELIESGEIGAAQRLVRACAGMLALSGIYLKQSRIAVAWAVRY